MGSEWRVGPEDWEQAVSRHTGPQVVVGGPGTGKTEFLVRRALHLVESVGVAPSSILMLSFSRRSASDLRQRFEQALDRSFTEVRASTFHSFAHRLLEAHAATALGWERMPSLLTGPEQVALVHELLAEEDPNDWPSPFRGLLDTQTFAREVTDFMLRASELLIDHEDLETRARDRADWKGLPGFVHRYQKALRTRHRIDYGTLQAQAVRLLGNVDVIEEVADQYRFILVDEYQDTTVAQARMLELLFLRHRNLVVAGDPYQSIYSFRGADLRNLRQFPDRFTDEDGGPAQRIVLTTSFRVPARILAAAVRVTAGGELPGSAGTVVPAPGGGSVETYGFDQQSEEAEWIAAETQRIHLTDRIPYRKIAVLVRTKRRLLSELSRALDRRGIPHDPPDARLTDRAAVRIILDCVIASTEKEPEVSSALRRILLGRLFRAPMSLFAEMERHRTATNSGWVETLRAHLSEANALADFIEDNSWATRLPAVHGFWKLWVGLPQFADVALDEASFHDRAALGSLAQVLTRLAERDPEATLADYVRWSEEEDFEAIPLLSHRRPDEDRLTLTTLHQAKGEEFDVVFIADAVEGVFPDLRHRESLLGTRHLNDQTAIDRSDYLRFRLQEERRLAYTAMCRARLRVVWTATAEGLAAGEGSPSRFLALVAGAPTVSEAAGRPPSGEPVTPLDAEARLRRTVRFDTGAAKRLAAISILARGDDWGLRPPAQFSGVLEPGPDQGLLIDELKLSPSQAESYEGCPRRYAFERRLRIGDEPNVYLHFGAVMHEVLEAAERLALERGDARATLEEARHQLAQLWDDAPFGGGPWASAWRRRAEDLLERLYTSWPTQARALLLEHPLTLDIDGTPWRGRADRIEIEKNGRVRIVDYKTGRTPAPKYEARESLQLGFYSLAAAEDSDITDHGEVHEAELWYPAAQNAETARRAFEMRRLPLVRERLVEVASAIRREDWTPKPGKACDTCRVRLVCPAWPEGREAYRG